MSNRPDYVVDSLSAILTRIGLSSEIFMRADLCGAWAMDTSGQRKVPFHLIERGRGWLHVEGQDSPRRLDSGDLIVFPHDRPHCLSSGPEKPPAWLVNRMPDGRDGNMTTVLCGFFVFHDRNAWPLLDSLAEVIVLNLMEQGGRHSAYFLLQLILEELKHERPGRSSAVNQLAFLLFILLLRSQMKAGAADGLLLALDDPHIGRALDLIHLDMQENWTVAGLANEVGMSRSAFSRSFARIVRKTPMRYLTEWRMQEAARLLRDTDVSMAAIAEQVGYQSEMAFRKAFRKVIGQTPGSVRRNGRPSAPAPETVPQRSIGGVVR